jgi:hypothetical protein
MPTSHPTHSIHLIHPIHNPHPIQEAATDRATTLRARAADYLLLALELFETPALEKYAHTRYLLLALWWYSCAHHPNSDCIMVSHATSNILRHLESTFHSPSLSFFSISLHTF